jgi:hypothetical protein
MRLAVFATAATVALQPALGADLHAQAFGCSGFGVGARTAGGAFLGAWVGFVAAKMKLSDWNDASHSSSAIRQRNQITIGGAVLGAVAANLVFRHPCQASRRATYAGMAKENPGRRAITLEEIQKSGVTGSMYDLVYALRRNWLNTRGVGSLMESPRYVTTEDGKEQLVLGEPELIVYLDQMKMGSVEQLRDLPIAGVVEVRYYDPSQATFKFGGGHSRGAIQIISVSDPAAGVKPQPFQIIAPSSIP